MMVANPAAREVSRPSSLHRARETADLGVGGWMVGVRCMYGEEEGEGNRDGE